MRWLFWATIDLENGLGGVEAYARSLARELRKMGVEAVLSHNPSDLKNEHWDVLHTHGSGIPLFFRPPTRNRHGQPAIRVHSLHGTTLGRMHACGEWLWPGGHLATVKEVQGVLSADVVLGAHDQLYLFQLAQKLGKVAVASSNGWDPYEEDQTFTPSEALKKQVEKAPPYWVFLGRGSDVVKGTDILQPALSSLPHLHLLSIPGDGFASSSQITPTGRLTPEEVRYVLIHSQGLVMSSRYEGLPLALLEALGLGIPAVAPRVGGIKTLSPQLKGLFLTEELSSVALADALSQAQTLSNTETARDTRAEFNQKLLSSWSQIAGKAYRAVLPLTRKHKLSMT